MKDNTVLLAAVAVAGLFLYSRRAAAAPAAGGRSYATPTAVAEMLASAVNAITRGTRPAAPAGVFATPTRTAPAIVAGTPESGLAGWLNYGDPYGTGDPYSSGIGGGSVGASSGWTTPTFGAVADLSVARFGAYVDGIAAAPVYDPSTDGFAVPKW